MTVRQLVRLNIMAIIMLRLFMPVEFVGAHQIVVDLVIVLAQWILISILLLHKLMLVMSGDLLQELRQSMNMTLI